MHEIYKFSLEIIVIILISLCIMGMFFSDNLIFRPRPSSYVDNKEIIKLSLSDGVTISAKYWQANKDNSNSYVVLLSHGNSEDIGTILPLIAALQNKGYSVISYDYPGYGTSTGVANEENSYAAAEAVLNYLTSHNVKHTQIIVYGHSLGAAMAIHIANKYDIGGLFIESAFVSTFRVFTTYPILPFDKFNNIKKIANITAPKVIVHGHDDNVIPFWHGAKLFAAAPKPKAKLWVPNASHNDCLKVAQEEYWHKWDLLLEMMEDN
jgi:abhydrolase domain-containing protein 17